MWVFMAVVSQKKDSCFVSLWASMITPTWLRLTLLSCDCIGEPPSRDKVNAAAEAAVAATIQNGSSFKESKFPDIS